MDYHFTLNDVLNRQGAIRMAQQEAWGFARRSYKGFVREAQQWQAEFRERVLKAGEGGAPYLLDDDAATEGLIFHECFREEIMEALPAGSLRRPASGAASWMLANMTGSGHVAYNVFLPMRHDLEGAKRMLNQLLGGGEISAVRGVDFEMRPRPRRDYLGDSTSFDVFLSCTDAQGRQCGVGVEVKFTERAYSLKGSSREYLNIVGPGGELCLAEPYRRATEGSGYYLPDVSAETLVSNRFRQVWRNHILGAAMVERGDISRFWSVTLYPQANVHFSLDAMPCYKRLLTPEGYQSCVPLSYENLFELIDRNFNFAGASEWVAYLRERYVPK